MSRSEREKKGRKHLTDELRKELFAWFLAVLEERSIAVSAEWTAGYQAGRLSRMTLSELEAEADAIPEVMKRQID